MKVSMFKRWCYENKLTGKRSDSNLSHVLMDGGVLTVPFDKLNAFYEQYIEAVKRNEKLFVVEQKTDIYNFFVDIDYKNNEALTLDEIKDICKIICMKVKSHGGRDCLVSVAPPKKVGDKVKTGIHLNWPDFVVDQRSAIALREHILIALYTAKGSIEWNEIIDSAVYGDVRRGSKGSGFRMPFSHKKGRHNACFGKGCVECNGEGKITQVAYLPVFIYKYGPLNALMPVKQIPTMEIMKMATVRTNSIEYKTIESPTKAIKEGSFSNTEMKDEMNDIETISELEKFIQSNFEGQSCAIIKSVYKNKNQYFISTTSQYCENLGRNHGSNHIWFYVSGDIIAQKCFCRCETLVGRKNGFCKDFLGKRYTLTQKLKQLLYPTQVKCPEMKTKPPITKEDDIKFKPELQTFIRCNVPGQENVNIMKITKNKSSLTIVTTGTYCDIIKNNHEKCISYKVNGDILSQECPCKRKLNIKLSPKIFNMLKKK